MSDLDDEILDNLHCCDDPESRVEAIKQAFTDAGYVNTKSVGFEGFSVKNLMTGQAWYNRFLKEYDANEHPMVKDSSIIREQVFPIAKRAAGLEVSND